MKTVEMKVPELALFGMTRGALGAGLALLISTRLDDRQRCAAGIALMLVGVLTTVPFALRIFGEEE